MSDDSILIIFILSWLIILCFVGTVIYACYKTDKNCLKDIFNKKKKEEHVYLLSKEAFNIELGKTRYYSI